MNKVLTAALSSLVGMGVIGLLFLGMTTLDAITAASLRTQVLVAAGAASMGITALYATMKGSDY